VFWGGLWGGARGLGGQGSGGGGGEVVVLRGGGRWDAAGGGWRGVGEWGG